MGVSVRVGKRSSNARMKYVYSNRPSKVIHVQEVCTLRNATVFAIHKGSCTFSSQLMSHPSLAAHVAKVPCK